MFKKYFAPTIAAVLVAGAAIAQVPISSLPSVPTLTGNEYFPIVRNGVTYKATPDQVRAVTGSVVNGTWTGNTIGSAYGGAGTLTGLLKANGSGTVSAAVSSVDYAPATSGTSILYGNGSGGFSGVNIGTGLSFAGGVLSASAAGTVTSVGLSLPGSMFTISGSPVTGSGTLSASFASQSAGQFFAGPSGSSGTPSFRSIVSADIAGSFTGITGVGTLTAGTWNATAIGTQYGGLGANNSASSGVPLFATGVVTMTSTNGTGNFVRATGAAIGTPAITGGTIDNAVIGGTTRAAVNGTTGNFNSTLTTNVTGSTQCLQANSSGVVSGTGSSCAVAAANRATLSNTTRSGISTTSGVMLGFGSTLAVTPASTGRIRVSLAGFINPTNTSDNVITLYYGTGAAPANGAAIPGGATATDGSLTLSTTPAVRVNASFPFEIAGLSIGTAYWFDYAVTTSSGATIAITARQVVAQEMVP